MHKFEVKFRLHSLERAKCGQLVDLLQSPHKDAKLRSELFKRNDQDAVAQHCKSHKKCRRKARAAQYSLAPFGAVLKDNKLPSPHNGRLPNQNMANQSRVARCKR